MNHAAIDIEDAEAARRTLGGDTGAFEVIVRRYQGPVYRLMLRFVRDDDLARDLAQEAFLRAFERLDSFDGERRFFPWLYTLATNLARDHARRKKVQAVPLPDDATGCALSKEPEAEAFVEGRLAAKALYDLPDDYREALALRYMEDFSLDEVARALGLSLSGAKMRVHRGLAMLRKRFGEET